MKQNKEVLTYLKEYKDRGEIEIDETKGKLSIICDIQSAFESINDCKRLKGYLRNNGFESDRMGTYTRYTNSKGEFCSAYEYYRERNKEYVNTLCFKTPFEILNNLITKNNGLLTTEIAVKAMEEYGPIYQQKYFAELLRGK
jgi:hypothetical protein